MPDYLKKSFFINSFIITIIFSLDRISKFYIILKSETNLSSSLFTSKFLNINLIWNEGIAFGLFSFNENYLYNLLTILIVIVIFIILIMIIKSEGFKRYALSMIFGGAVGNLYDRIFYSAVPDFIDFHIKDFHWFIFNVADIFITIGVIIMILSEFRGNRLKNEAL
mgnify:CR=1 FL=1|tara:strand:+ start:72 stop:569 length:498 start_codon:yes stop_codon:yes gene_type:complete